MSDRPLIVIPSKSPGGSPAGLSYWKKYDECVRKERIRKEAEATQIPDPDRYPDAAQSGVLFHELMFWYAAPEWYDSVALSYDGYDLDPDWKEALRLFSEYRKHYPPDEFEWLGRAKSFEFGYGGQMGSDMTATEVLILQEHCLDLFGVPHYTGRWDGVINIPDQAMVDRVSARRAILLPEPGIYLYDTKTMKAHRGTVALEFSESEQFFGYMMAWDELNPDNKCKGMLTNCVARHNNKTTAAKQKKAGERATGLTKDSFWSIFVPPPTEEQQEIFKTNMQQRNDKKQRYGEDSVNTAFCFYYGACSALTDGTCDRIPRPPR